MIKPAVQAAVCFLAIDILRRLELDGRSKHAVIQRLGLARSHAYEKASWLAKQLDEDSLAGNTEPGTGESPGPRLCDRIRIAILEYRVKHPGAWQEGQRTIYSRELQRFVLSLAAEVGVGDALNKAEFAQAAGIPLPTLKDWWAASSPHKEGDATISAAGSGPREFPPPAPGDSQAAQETPPTATEPKDAHLGLTVEMIEIVRIYEQWSGTFSGFVVHLGDEYGLRYGKKAVADILHLANERKLVRRPLPKPRARGSMFLPPPGVQWTSDGKETTAIVDGEPIKIVLQPTMDVGSNAIVGAAARPAEDTAGVVASFNEGQNTTGEAPEFFLLDNKQCNKSAQLKAALPEKTNLMHSTPGRAQNKAPIEGAFGLFVQELGDVVANIDTSTPQSTALGAAEAVLRAWSVGRNGRPRRKNGLSPIELYRQGCSREERKAAISHLDTVKARIDARVARDASRRDPTFVATLNAACRRFGFTEDGDVIASMHSLSLTAIENAIAIYATKQRAGSLPVDVGLRYFRGIARNCQHDLELRFYEEELVALLRSTRRLAISHLEQKALSFAHLEPASRLRRIVNELIAVPAPVAQVFWRQHFVLGCASVPSSLREATRWSLCDRIRRHFAATKGHRKNLLDLVIRQLVVDSPSVPLASVAR